MPSVRLASVLLIIGTGLLSFLAMREYGRLVDYCEGSPEVAAGGDELSCLEPQHWFAESMIAAVLILLEVALVVVFVAAIHRRGRQQR